MKCRESKHVAVLLCTYNGEAYLGKQLDSIISQSYEDWSVHISDDGSIDSTKTILENYQRRFQDRICIYEGPRKGFAWNFISLVKNMSREADYYAFCDQDDIWHAEKLETAIEVLAKRLDVPALYCGRTKYVDAHLQRIGFSPLFKRSPSFENALVQSIAGGNTMVFNKAARDVIVIVDQDKKIISHDWWCYLAVTAVGGYVFYDPVAYTDYRQHGQNLVGSNSSLRERVHRLKKLFKGTFIYWNDCNLDLVQGITSKMPAKQSMTYLFFLKSRQGNLFKRLYWAAKSNVYRQTFFGNVGLLVAYVLGKV